MGCHSTPFTRYLPETICGNTLDTRIHFFAAAAETQKGAVNISRVSKTLEWEANKKKYILIGRGELLFKFNLQENRSMEDVRLREKRFQVRLTFFSSLFILIHGYVDGNIKNGSAFPILQLLRPRVGICEAFRDDCLIFCLRYWNRSPLLLRADPSSPISICSIKKVMFVRIFLKKHNFRKKRCPDFFFVEKSNVKIIYDLDYIYFISLSANFYKKKTYLEDAVHTNLEIMSPRFLLTAKVIKYLFYLFRVDCSEFHGYFAK